MPRIVAPQDAGFDFEVQELWDVTALKENARLRKNRENAVSITRWMTL